MNGARLTFMRKGYWLTALATAVLLAASSGTVLAQDIGIKSVEVDGANSANEVQEGTTTTVTVTLTEDWTSATAAVVTLLIQAPENDSNNRPSGQEPNGKGNLEVTASTAGGPADLLLGSILLAINTGQDEVSIALQVNNDLDAVNEKFEIMATLTQISGVTVDADDDALTGNFAGKIVDDETQTYEFEVETDEDEILEASTFMMTLKAKPNRPAQEQVTLYLRAPKGYAPSTAEIPAAMLTSDGLTLGDGETNGGTHPTSQTIDVKAPSNDKNRDDDVIMLEAVTGSVVSNRPVGTSDPITVLDIHQLPTDISGEANGADEDGKETDAVVTMVAEGGKAFLYVTVVNESDDRISGVEDFTVTPTLAGGQVLDARIMPTNLKVTEDDEESGGKYVVGPFTIEAVADEDIGMETLMVSLDVTGNKNYGSGTTSGTFSIGIEDETAPLVFVKDGAYEAIMMAIGDAVTQGSVVTIMTDDMFGMDEGYTASFGTSVEGDSISASASGDRVTLTASSDATGESKVTVTATARMESSSFIPSQTVSNVAEITFPVMVEEAAEPDPDVPDPDAPEPVPTPALPLIAQWLLGLGLMGGGARQLFRRRRQG